MSPPEPRNEDEPTAHAASEAARARLEEWPRWAFLVDPHAATIVAANAPGRTLFPALPATLDAAMPAIRTLREIARGGKDSVPAVPLVFWAGSGIEAMIGEVERVAGTPWLMVRTATAAIAKTEPVADGAPERTDSETMEEIARKIRDGQSRFLPGPLLLPPPAAVEPTVEPAQALVPSDKQVEEKPVALDLAKLAHELKTPLSAIRAASEIMKEGRFGTVGNERYAGYISDIHASAGHALELIQRMLNRREEPAAVRTPELRFEKVALDEIVEACLSAVRPLAAAKGLTLTSKPSETQATVTADATALKQIVLNLLTNAMKFTPPGGDITVAIVGSRRGAAALTVADTGPGMSAVAIAEALRPMPLATPRTRDGGGLGIGLPLSRALTEAMGAALSIDSAPGLGTRVTISFPGGPLVAI